MSEAIHRKIIRAKEVRELTGLSRNEPYRRGNDPEDPFPSPIELGPHARGWYLDEVLAWVESRPRTVQKSAAA